VAGPYLYCEYPPPPGVFGATFLFSMGWSEGTIVKYIVFRNLEAKLLKTEYLRGIKCDIRPTDRPRFLKQHRPHDSRLVDRENQSAIR